MISSTYYFYMKTKILANFQICISVSLNSSYWEKLTYSKLVVFSEWKFHKLALVSRGLTFAKFKILRIFFQLLDGLKKQKRVRIFSKNEHIQDIGKCILFCMKKSETSRFQHITFERNAYLKIPHMLLKL